MCEANAYMFRETGEELVLESVDKVFPGKEGILLVNVFGQQKLVKAKIIQLALVDHKILLEEC